jgi:hypothetical protein
VASSARVVRRTSGAAASWKQQRISEEDAIEASSGLVAWCREVNPALGRGGLGVAGRVAATTGKREGARAAVDS